MATVYLMTRTPEGYVVQSERTASLDTFIQTMDELGTVYNDVLGVWESNDGFDYWPRKQLFWRGDNE